jgi:hypothetical protein
MDRNKQPLGHAWASAWRNGRALDDRVGKYLGVQPERSHALNDTHAAALAAAFAYTRRDSHGEQKNPRLALVLRLAGAVGGATIGIERPDLDTRLGPTSGFPKSVLIGAGEFGHFPLDAAIVDARNDQRMSELGPLLARRCSCSDPADLAPHHLEAYAGTSAVAHRVSPGEPECDVIRRVVGDQANPVHRQALEDVGTLVGHALLGPVALLNPAAITLTGSLAVQVVRDKLRTIVSEAQVLGREPYVSLLNESVEGDEGTIEGKFARAKGAALGVLRTKVYRRFEELLDGRRENVEHKVEMLTSPLTKLPW